MTIVKASCCECGDVVLAPADILLADHSYSFDCPGCDMRVSVQLSPRTRGVLLSIGCRYLPPITHAEVQTFIAALAASSLLVPIVLEETEAV